MRYATLNGFSLGEPSQQGRIQLGGACGFAGALSPNNGLPLTQHVLLKAGLSCLEDIGWSGNMPLLYSWKCAIYTEDFSYRVGDGRIQFIYYGEGVIDTEGFPYPEYPVIFPPVMYHDAPVTTDYFNAVNRLNDMAEQGEPVPPSGELWDLMVPRHQFGGVPYLLSPASCQAACPSCGNIMPVFATVADDSGVTSKPFFGNAYVQLVYLVCSLCAILRVKNVST